MDISETMMRFCLASRHVYNHYFRVTSPYENDGWETERRFREVESVLFEKLVVEPEGLPDVRYGEANPRLGVATNDGRPFPAMINRDTDSGYWDFPKKEIASDAVLLFLTFFDWDQLEFRDNRYVRVLISQWPSCKAAEGKHALIERRHVRFVLRNV